MYWEDQEDEIHEEVGIIKFIKVQLDYGMQRQGSEKEAIWLSTTRC